MLTLNNFQDIFLVSIGALFGANARFIIYQKFKEININEHLNILAINTFSSFLLGVLISILSKIKFLNFSYQLGLFFLVGFIGSLSTFSTFVYDLFDSFLRFKFLRALKSFALSFSLGVIALALGSFLSNN